MCNLNFVFLLHIGVLLNLGYTCLGLRLHLDGFFPGMSMKCRSPGDCEELRVPRAQDKRRTFVFQIQVLF